MSSLIKKYLMALTGIVLVGFVFGHMAGNLQMFLHPDWINEYAYKLQHLPYGLLWVVRFFLLLCLVVHVTTAVLLVIENKKARPVAYSMQTPLTSTFAARTMRYTGLIVLAFIAYHLAHFTLLVTNPEFKDLETPLYGVEGKHGMESRTLWGVYDKLTNHGENPTAAANNVHDVYTMVAAGFKSPLVSGFYLLSMVLLCMHLSHGISSMFQSLGLRNALWRARLDIIAKVLSVVLFLGFSSLPVAGLLGLFDGCCTVPEVTATLTH
jgi:succinate dehydrogenase / fumarate reductase cytochrome b subunit